MESRFLSQNRSPIPSLPLPRHSNKLNHSNVVAVLTRTSEKINGVKEKKNSDNLMSITRKTVYNDSWFDQLAINHLSQSVQAATGLRNSKSGYESLVQAAIDASQKFTLIHQRELVLQALDKAIPRPILDLTTTSRIMNSLIARLVQGPLSPYIYYYYMPLIKTLMPQTKFTREYFAAFTTLFFVWLIGTCEVRESEFNGRKEKNVVHIKKCRFLEETNCAGMCTNLCKAPTQTFIKQSLGMPVNMVPNFDDMSCEMIFGQDPPTLTDDPAFKQPCYKLCKTNKKHTMKCSI